MSAKQYVDLPDLTVYDSEMKDYIDEQGFVKGSGTSGYIPKFNGAGSITNCAELGNDTTKYLRNDGTWAVPPGSGGITGLDDIPDVNLTSPTSGQALVYDSQNNKWVNGSLASNLGGLSDVTLTTPSNGQILKFDGSDWINDDETKPTVLTASLAANATTCTFTNAAIGSDTRIEVFTSVYGVDPSNMVVSGNTLTLTFSSSHVAATIKVHLWN